MSNNDATASKPRARFYKVKSFTTKGVEYTVRHTPDDLWHCDCPRQTFKNQECKHIQVAKAMEKYPFEGWRVAQARARIIGEAK